MPATATKLEDLKIEVAFGALLDRDGELSEVLAREWNTDWAKRVVADSGSEQQGNTHPPQSHLAPSNGSALSWERR